MFEVCVLEVTENYSKYESELDIAVVPHQSGDHSKCHAMFCD